jgi:DNA repair exonuclease SbcCD ATPase subunit
MDKLIKYEPVKGVIASKEGRYVQYSAVKELEDNYNSVHKNYDKLESELKKAEQKIAELEKTPDGCGRQFYHGTNQYPDHTCYNGYLQDDDADYHSEDATPCPFCNPKELAEDELSLLIVEEYNVRELLESKVLSFFSVHKKHNDMSEINKTKDNQK